METVHFQLHNTMRTVCGIPLNDLRNSTFTVDTRIANCRTCWGKMPPTSRDLATIEEWLDA